MAMQADQRDEALRDYATAYDYFFRFTAASELDSMVELMYNQLSGLPWSNSSA